MNTRQPDTTQTPCDRDAQAPINKVFTPLCLHPATFFTSPISIRASLVLAFFSLLFVPGLCKAEMIQQNYVDSLINRSLYLLSTASADAGADYTLQEAVQYGQGVVARLKKQAKGDPNEKYILFKARELEAQLYLEQQGLAQENTDNQQRQVNELVLLFNTEIASPRPDFNNLLAICAQMSAQNKSKGAELTGIVARRRKRIAVELDATIQRAIAAADMNTARRDLAYCATQRENLGIPLSRYSQLLAKVEARTTIDTELNQLDSLLSACESALHGYQLAPLATELSYVALRLEQIKPRTIPKIWDRTYYRHRRLERALANKEDSLLVINLNVLKTQGIGSARAFLDTVLVARGVRQDQIGKVDYAILEQAMTLSPSALEIARAAQPDPALTEESDTLQVSVLNDLLLTAKKNAQEKNQAKKKELAQRAGQTHMEQVRSGQLQIAREDAAKRQLGREDYAQTRAREALVSIYTMLEKGEREQARQELDATQRLLSENLSSEEFLSVQKAVLGAGGSKE